MVNDVFDGISIKLNEEFGDSYPIYSEQVDQHFTEKCFYIDLLKPLIQPYVGDRYLRIYPFDIRFYPIENNNMNVQMCDVADKLIEVLRYITVDGNLVRGINMNYEIVDDVLHFMVQYNIIVKRIKEQEFMETYDLDQFVKG